GDLADRLDVVDDGRGAERALDGRGRRVELGPSPPAPLRRDQARLLPADGRAPPPKHRHRRGPARAAPLGPPPGRPPRSAAPEVRPLHGVGDRGRLQGEGLGPRGVAARLPVRRERVRVGPPEVAGEDRLGRRRRRLAHRTLPARNPRPPGRGGAPISMADCPWLELSTRSASGPGDNQAVGPLGQPSKRRWCWTGRLPRSQAGRRTVNLKPQGQDLGLKHGLLSPKAPDFSPGDVYRSWSISRSTVSGVRLPSY